MTRDIVVISWKRCRLPWGLAAVSAILFIGCALATWRWTSAARDLSQERLVKESEFREQGLDLQARRRRAAAEAAVVDRLRSSPLDASAIAAVSSVRSALRDSGLPAVTVEAGPPREAGSVEVVPLQLRGPASYRGLRAFLARIDAREVPVGWERLSYDGDSFSADLLLISRSGT